MKIPINLGLCSECSTGNTVWVDLHSDSITGECGKCKKSLDGSIDLNFTIGLRGLARSSYELTQTKDYSLAVLFSAMGIEWELVRLFIKWNEINALQSGKELKISEITAVLRKHKKIIYLLKETGKLLHTKGFDQYVKESSRLRAIISSGYPSLKIENLASRMEKEVFWVRNEIIHQGLENVTCERAERIYAIARLVVYVLNRMDSELGKRVAP